MIYKIEKPDISKIKVERIFDLIKIDGIQKILEKSLSPYANWTQVKYFSTPENIKPEEIWAVIKFIRNNIMLKNKSLILDNNKKHFYWQVYLPEHNELLHQIDMKLGESITIFGSHIDERFKYQLLSRGAIEEAIASSQLEGAHTTRKVAKEMLYEKRTPKTVDEHMIVNNYNAMVRIEEDLKNKKMDMENLLSLHEVLTINTFKKEDIGRLRKDSDNIVVSNDDGSIIYHIPPKEDQLKKEVHRLIDYLNDELNERDFIHPVIKAIFIHFWIGYLHPFVDGNGRIARTLFYWYLLKNKYSVFGYIPLSTVIKKSWGQYRDSYLYSEQDENDLTYFIDYNIRKIKQALNDFETYINKKIKENANTNRLVREKYKLNDRQTNLLRYFYKNKSYTTSVTTYSKVNNITRLTASKHLHELKNLGFLTSKRNGKTIYYYATDKIEKLFE